MIATLSDKQLKIAYWFVTHKEQLRKAGLWAFAVVDAALVVGSIVGSIVFVIGLQTDQQRVTELIGQDVTFASVRVLPTPLAVQSVTTVPSGEGVDVVARIANPNAVWAARRVSYYFTRGGAPLEPHETFVLPGSTSTIVQFGAARGGGDSDLVITDVQWKRVASRQRVQDGIETANMQIVQPAPNLPVRVRFTARNTAPQGYWNVAFIIVGKSAGRIVGVTAVSVEQFVFGKEIVVEAPLSGRLASATRFEIEPRVNVFDPSVFMPVTEGGSGEVK